jgi:hypothetical protein
MAGDWDINTYGIYAGYSFTPAIQLKGVYYFQDLGASYAAMLQGEDSPKAWKAILDVKQDLLKFTNLWFEYSQEDNSFAGTSPRYGIGGANYAGVNDNRPWNTNTTKYIFVRAKQQWNDKWSTFLRYAQADYDTVGYDDAKEYGLGVGYQFTPAIYFELMYDQTDYGTGVAQKYQEKDSVVRFRTNVNF